MDQPRTVADIMITALITVGPEASVARARALMQQHGIRHLPVVDDAGALLGVVTQRTMLAEVLRIADRVGIQGLEQEMAGHPVTGLLGGDVEQVQPQLPLVEAGRYFLSCKHGCLPVVDGGRLVGMITSADFVRLSVALLEGGR